MKKLAIIALLLAAAFTIAATKQANTMTQKDCTTKGQVRIFVTRALNKNAKKVVIVREDDDKTPTIYKAKAWVEGK